MTSILTILLFICISSFKCTSIYKEIDLLLESENNVSSLLKNSERVAKNDGTYFLIEYVEKFEHFTKNLKLNEYAGSVKNFEVKELAQKMNKELQNLMVNKIKNPEKHVNLKKEAEKLVEIQQNMKNIEKILEENINVEMEENEMGENQQVEGTLSAKINNLLEKAFGDALPKIEELIRKTKQWAVGISGLPTQQAEFFAMMELNLQMLGPLQTIAENSKKMLIVPQLEEIDKELNKLKGEIGDKLKIKRGQIGLISELEGIEEIGQIFPELFEKIMADLEELKKQNEIEESEPNEKHPKDIKKHSEKYEKLEWFVEKFKNDIYFHNNIYFVRKQIKEMGRILEKIQADIVAVKGVENIRKSFDVLKEMRKVTIEDELQKLKNIAV